MTRHRALFAAVVTVAATLAEDLLTSLLHDHGVRTGGHGLTVRLGGASDETPSQAEGYGLSVSRATAPVSTTACRRCGSCSSIRDTAGR
jgi:hypothetical protein